MNTSNALMSCIAALKERHGAKRLAQAIGRDEDTITRNRETLEKWKVTELLALACAYPEVGAALRALLDDHLPKVGTPQTLFSEVMREVTMLTSLTSTIAKRLEDGDVSQQDAREILAELRSVVLHAERTLIPSLELRVADRDQSKR